jgi:toxin ParE1/3/4
MQFHVSKEAEQDLDEIFVYWARNAGLGVADRTVEAIEERFALMGDFPRAGRRREEIGPGVRSFPAGEYLIYFRKSRSAVEIIHIFHGARDQRRAFLDAAMK